MNNPIGVMIVKKIMAITIGETIFPSKFPNFIHNLFRGSNNIGLIIDTNKNIRAIIRDYNLIS